MSISTDLLKSPHIGIRNLKMNFSKYIKNNEPIIVTNRGVPINIVMPYSDMIELLDIIDELTDIETMKTVLEGRKAIKSGAKGIPVSNLFNQIRAKRK